MKTIFLIISVLSLGSTNSVKNPSDFDYELSSIVNEFRNKIMDRGECERLKVITDNLIDEIKDAIGKKEHYSYEEISTLKILKKETEALEVFISSVGNCGNVDPSIKEFFLANKRVKANVSYVVRDKYCVDAILVEIGDYVAYQIINNSTKRYSISYKWKSQDRISSSSGSGNFGLMKNHVRHVYDNRDDNSKKNISFTKISCELIPDIRR